MSVDTITGFGGVVGKGAGAGCDGSVSTVQEEEEEEEEIEGGRRLGGGCTK